MLEADEVTKVSVKQSVDFEAVSVTRKTIEILVKSRYNLPQLTDNITSAVTDSF